MIAKRIKTLSDWHGFACIYEMVPPFKGCEFVVVSSAHVPFSGPETLMFPSDGEIVTSFGEIAGERGVLSHQHVLESTGYKMERS